MPAHTCPHQKPHIPLTERAMCHSKRMCALEGRSVNTLHNNAHLTQA